MGWEEAGQPAEPVGLVLCADLSCGWKTRGGRVSTFFHLGIIPNINNLIADGLLFTVPGTSHPDLP